MPFAPHRVEGTILNLDCTRWRSDEGTSNPAHITLRQRLADQSSSRLELNRRQTTNQAGTIIARAPEAVAPTSTQSHRRHTTACLSVAGVDRSAIGFLLEHESVETKQIYLAANLTMDERTFGKTSPPRGILGRSLSRLVVRSGNPLQGLSAHAPLHDGQFAAMSRHWSPQNHELLKGRFEPRDDKGKFGASARSWR